MRWRGKDATSGEWETVARQGEDVSRTVSLLLHPTTHGSAMEMSLHPHQIHCLPLLPARHYRRRFSHCSHRPAAIAARTCWNLFGGHRHCQRPAWVPACEHSGSSAHRTTAVVMCAAQLLSGHSALSLSLQFSLSSRCICSYPYCMIFFISLPSLQFLYYPIQSCNTISPVSYPSRFLGIYT
jgi:hypothetical protein